MLLKCPPEEVQLPDRRLYRAQRLLLEDKGYTFMATEWIKV